MLSSSSGTALKTTQFCQQSNLTRTGSFRNRPFTVHVVSDFITDPPSAWPKRALSPKHIPKPTERKSISVIGSTGSIGTQTLEVCWEHPNEFQVVALSAGTNVELLSEQIRQFKPKLVSVQNSKLASILRDLIQDVVPPPEIVIGINGVIEVARHSEAQTVVSGIAGCVGLRPTAAAIEAGKDICLANKETLIAGGPYVLPLAQKHKVHILPADSEHSAIFQCIQGLPDGGLRRIILTASGGAFRDWPNEKLRTARVKDALKHPNWRMGKKFTVDSATLMNKCLEVIEAHYLFGVDYNHIDVVIHPQSIIHSMVETADSSVLAQLGWPDMRLPILYTLSWPKRVHTSEETWPRLDFVEMGDLTFRSPDFEKYPALELAYAVGYAGGTMTGVFSAANEKAVELFLDEKISYIDIVKYIEATCEHHKKELDFYPGIDEIVYFDKWARNHVIELYEKAQKLSV
eukprot:g8843.t1